MKVIVTSGEEETAEEEAYDEWEISSAVDTLIRAEEIRKDPELMALVMPKIEEKQSALSAVKKSPKSLADLKKIANDMPDDGDDAIGDEEEANNNPPDHLKGWRGKGVTKPR